MRMRPILPADWSAWRAPSPLGGRRPDRSDLEHALRSDLGRDDVLPYPTDEQSAGMLQLLMVGINPSPWTSAVNAPFARPGNRFWPSLHLAGLTGRLVDASRGLVPEDERMLAELGLGITNLVERPTARAAELAAAELREGASRLVERVQVLRPSAVAVLGITAFRAAFELPRAQLGEQDVSVIDRWPTNVPLWVVPNPSGLNAHETTASLAEKWRQVLAASTARSASSRRDVVDR